MVIINGVVYLKPGESFRKTKLTDNESLRRRTQSKSANQWKNQGKKYGSKK